MLYYRNYIPTLKTYKVPSRFFNFIVSINDLQGDGFFTITLILFWRAFQFVLPFNANKYFRNIRRNFALLKPNRTMRLLERWKDILSLPEGGMYIPKMYNAIETVRVEVEYELNVMRGRK